MAEQLQPMSEEQAAIVELRQQATGPEDHAYLDEVQKAHDAGRATLGLGPEDPALQQVAKVEDPNAKKYQVDSAGHVNLGDGKAEDLGPYDNGRRS